MCAVLLALPLLGSGANTFVPFFDVPYGGGTEGERLLGAMSDGGLMHWVGIGHVGIGVLLLIPRSRFFAGLMQLPISLGIVAFNMSLLPQGVPVAVALLLLNLGVLRDSARVRQLFERAQE
jgi:hypothetical protein